MPRILFISSSIGLGHAARDLAIAEQLRGRRPDLEIDWLAGHPATRLIEAAGESILPEAAVFQETGFAEDSAEEFSLNLTRYATRALGAWARAARAILNVTRRRSYDLVVGDETYELTIAFALAPRLKKLPWVIIYDFFGLDAMTRNPLERGVVHVLNRIWCGGGRGKPSPFDLTLFVGEPDDVPDAPLGWRLPNARDYAERHFQFTGYALGFDPSTYTDRHNLRRTLGYNEHPLILCSVGGTAVGARSSARGSRMRAWSSSAAPASIPQPSMRRPACRYTGTCRGFTNTSLPAMSRWYRAAARARLSSRHCAGRFSISRSRATPSRTSSSPNAWPARGPEARGCTRKPRRPRSPTRS